MPPRKEKPCTQRTKRANWLIIHKGGSTLFAEEINEAMQMSLVKECHSIIQDDFVYTLVHLCDQKRANTLGHVATTMLLPEFHAVSFTNSNAAFETPVIKTMARCFQEQDRTLVSSWKKNVRPKPGFFFHSLLTKHSAPTTDNRTWGEKRKKLLARITELEIERDEYKKKAEELAAAAADRMIN
jgi:hypothetical protein